MHIDLKKLRVFVAIAEHASMYEAAEHLGVSQSWVSAQLKQLEGSLDLSLVTRGKGHFDGLSPSGAKLLPIAQRLIGECSTVDREIEALRRRAKGTVVIGVDPITLYIPERNQLLNRFLNDSTGQNLKIVTTPPSELFAGLNRGDFDLILTSQPKPDASIELLPLYKHELKLLVPTALTEGLDKLMGGDLSGARILTLANDYHPLMSNWLKTTLSSSDIKWVQCPETSFQALIHYAATMMIATLVPDFPTIEQDMLGKMKLRRVRNADMMVHWGLMRRTGDCRTAADRFWRTAEQSRAWMEMKQDRMRLRKPVGVSEPKDNLQPANTLLRPSEIELERAATR